MRNSFFIVLLFLTGCMSSYNAYSFSDGIIVTSALMGDTNNATERAFLLSHEVCHNVLGHTESMSRSLQDELDADGCAFKILKDNNHDACIAVEFMNRISEKKPEASGFKIRKDYWKNTIICS